MNGSTHFFHALRKSLSIGLISFFAFSLSLLAQVEIDLSGVTEVEYNNKMETLLSKENLKPVDGKKNSFHLKFADNASFTVELVTLNGNTTGILKITEGDHAGKILRIPKKRGAFRGGGTYEEFHADYYDGHKDLKNAGLTIPEIYKHSEGNYTIVENIFPDNPPAKEPEINKPKKKGILSRFGKKKKEIIIDPSDGINGDEMIEKFIKTGEQQYLDKIKEMTKFFDDANQFEYIGDLHAGQLVYSERKGMWVLLDWANDHDMLTSTSTSTLMDNFFDAIDESHSGIGITNLEQREARIAEVIDTLKETDTYKNGKKRFRLLTSRAANPSSATAKPVMKMNPYLNCVVQGMAK
jgi:hypothetical protein